MNVLLDVLRSRGGSVALDDSAVAVDEELGEVPKDVTILLHTLADALEEFPGGLGLQSAIFLGGSLSLEVLEYGFSIGAVDIGLGHQREGHAVVQAAELSDLVIGAGLLSGELVAREADDHETLVLIFLIKGLQAVVLRGETALGCCVDYHQNLAFKLGEVNLYTLVTEGFKIVNISHDFKC